MVDVEIFVSSKFEILAVVINAFVLVRPVDRFRVVDEIFVDTSFVAFNVGIDALVIKALAEVIPVEVFNVDALILVSTKFEIVASEITAFAVEIALELIVPPKYASSNTPNPPGTIIAPDVVDCEFTIDTEFIIFIESELTL